MIKELASNAGERDPFPGAHHVHSWGFLRVKQIGCEAEVKNVWSYTSLRRGS
jgi:hypothetical protein